MKFITSRFVIKEWLARELHWKRRCCGVLFVAPLSLSIVCAKRAVLLSRPFLIFKEGALPFVKVDAQVAEKAIIEVLFENCITVFLGA